MLVGHKFDHKNSFVKATPSSVFARPLLRLCEKLMLTTENKHLSVASSFFGGFNCFIGGSGGK